MDPKHLKSLQTFKKNSAANLAIQRKSTALKDGLQNFDNADKTESNTNINSKLYSLSSKANFGALAKIVRYLQLRHLNSEDHYLSVEEILEESRQAQVAKSTIKWLATEAMVNNPKIEFTPDKKGFRFKPVYRIKDGKALVRLLKQQDLKGLGGISLEDVKESLPKCDAILKKYQSEIIIIQRPKDKKQILYYNDKTAVIDIDDEFKKMWRSVTVNALEETKIEEYLEKQGLSFIRGERLKPIFKKYKRPSNQKRRPLEKPKDNMHVAKILESYDENGIPQKK